MTTNPARRSSPTILVVAITLVVLSVATGDWTDVGLWTWILVLVLMDYLPALRANRRVQAVAWVGTIALVVYVVWSIVR